MALEDFQNVPPAQDPKTSSSAKNEDGPQISHPDLRVDGTSKIEAAAAMSHSPTPIYVQDPPNDERMDVDDLPLESGVATGEIDDEEDESIKSTSARKASDPVSFGSPVPENERSIKEVGVQDIPTNSACQNPASSTVREMENGKNQMDMEKLLSELDRNATEKQDMLCSIWKRMANEDALRKQLGEEDAELKAIRAQLAEVDGQLARQTAAIRKVTGEVGRCPACWDHMDAPQVTDCGHTFCQECPVCRGVVRRPVRNFGLADLPGRLAGVLARGW
ncbi:hypothetical protein CAEBREN_10102 [Caenorhabditis brenneri]|uniref:Zinc finger RING-type eukaryotic domain-containing protein n=1 Tax=Caenorhabditis brenneri TaxID=135651 RepID=G0MLQ2_CAEBE|nr:hypothetical protein CAEBREN_10102 [Caenorhabditis brenneri]